MFCCIMRIISDKSDFFPRKTSQFCQFSFLTRFNYCSFAIVIHVTWKITNDFIANKQIIHQKIGYKY